MAVFVLAYHQRFLYPAPPQAESFGSSQTDGKLKSLKINNLINILK
jgi:hypothetical protein